MSDLHGNATAVRAVLADATTIGIDHWWILGDIIALGPEPVEVLELVAALPNVQAIAGNTERYVLTGDGPYPTVEDVRADPALLPRLVECTAAFSWTRGAVTAGGWFDWLAALPRQLRLDLPDGTRVLGIHASPRSDDGPGIDTRIDDGDLATLLAGCDADIVLGGHTHDATDRRVAGVRAVNPGSVSNPTRSDRNATYTVVEYDDSSYRVEHRVVEYDVEAHLRRIEAVRHPAASHLAHFYR